MDIMERNRESVKAHHVEFKRIFGTSLHQWVDPLFGFDVIAFDEKFIQPPDGESTAQTIERVYGIEARVLVETLIHV